MKKRTRHSRNIISFDASRRDFFLIACLIIFGEELKEVDLGYSYTHYTVQQGNSKKVEDNRTKKGKLPRAISSVAFGTNM